MKQCTVSSVAYGISLALVTVALAQDGTDNFVDTRFVLTGLSIRQTANNSGAMPEEGEPDHCQDIPAVHSMWWTWQSPVNGDVQIHTFGSDFDTVLAVYQGPDLASLAQVTCADNYAGYLQSQVEFSAVLGDVYYIAVDSAGDDTGNIVLRIRSPSLAPANDTFALRTSLASSTNVAAAGSNANAVPEQGESSRAGCPPLASTWWSWLAPTSCVVEVDTRGSTFDTVVGVYTGATLGALHGIAGNDNHGDDMHARVWFPAVSGVVYQVAVDTADGSEGDIALSIRPVDLPVITNLALIAANSIQVAWDSISGERYRVALSTNMQDWTSATDFVASAEATVVELKAPDSPTCFSRVERYLEP